MAKAKIEREPDAEETAQESPKKGGKLGTILIASGVGVLFLLVGAGGTFFLLKGQIAAMIQAQAPTAAATSEDGKAAAGEKKDEGFIGALFELDPMVVNLEQSRGKRYLKVKMSFELNKKAVQKELKARLPQLRDAILLMLSSKSFKDVSTVEGKLALRDALLTRINGLLTTGFIKRIYFEEFVVQ